MQIVSFPLRWEVPEGISSILKFNLREFPAFQVCLSTVSLRVDKKKYGRRSRVPIESLDVA